MVGIHYEELKIRQQEVEVRALAALAKSGTKPQKYMACKRLEEIAFPESLAEKINKEQTKLWIVNFAMAVTL